MIVRFDGMDDDALPFDVANRWTGDVEFTARINCGEDEPRGVKLGLALQWALRSRISLSAVDLSGAALSGAGLSGIDLSGADLSAADLSGADLSKANLSRTDLSASNLSGADLSWSNLSQAEVSNADLSGADLTGAEPSGASLSGTNLSEADLSGVDLSRVDLSRTDLSKTNLLDDELRPFKADLWLTLSTIGGPLEAQHLISKLRAGEVDGHNYGEGNDCACLIGTIGTLRGKSGINLDHDASRPAERWFTMIAPGDKPDHDTAGGYAARTALGWVERWCVDHGHPT